MARRPLAPGAVAAVFFLGVTLRRAGWAGAAQGRALLNFVFYVVLPILIFGALSGVTLAREHALLPAIAVCTALAGWVAAALLARRFRLPKKGEGAMSLCAMSMNIAMIYPFASLSLSPPAFSQLVMYDMGHAVMAWTLTTVVACKYGGHTDDIPVLLRRAWRLRRCGYCSWRWGSMWVACRCRAISSTTAW